MNSSVGTEENLEKKRNCGGPAWLFLRETYTRPRRYIRIIESHAVRLKWSSHSTPSPPGEPPYLIRRAALISSDRRSELFFRLPTKFLYFYFLQSPRHSPSRIRIRSVHEASQPDV